MLMSEGKADIRSAMKNVGVEPEGGTKIYIGDKTPARYENNWIQSNPKKGFFAYRRLYGPLESYCDKSWKMSDFKMLIEWEL